MTTLTFQNVSYTEASLNELTGPALVELYNAAMFTLRNGSEVSSVRRFADKATAVARTWKMLQRATEVVEDLGLEEVEAEEVEAPAVVVAEPVAVVVAPVVAVAAPKAAKKAKAPKARRGTNLVAPGFAPLPCLEGSKQAILRDALLVDGGASMAELIDALSGGSKPWVEATVRSGFGWDMKQKGYGVISHIDAEGVERFSLVLPEGFGPVAHRVRGGAAKQA